MKVDPAHRITAKELLDNQWLTVSYSISPFFPFLHATVAYFFSFSLVVYI